MPCIHIIEDDSDLLALLKLFFASHGYEVCDDYNGNRYEAGEELLPDVFLIDVQLKDKSGLDICRNLKTSLSPHPVIMMSALDNLPELARACGADSFIQKPFELDEIKRQLDAQMH